MTRRSSAPALFLLALLAGCSRDPPPIDLDRDVGAPLDRHLASGETQLFEIALEAGKLWVLRVDQRGIDLTVTVDGGRGTDRQVIDNWSGSDGAWGVERVVWVAETAQRCRMAVSATVAGSSGDFTLQIEQRRPASSEDRVWARAEAALMRGDDLYNLRGSRGVDRPATLGRASAAYREALADFETLGNRQRQADAWFRLAEARRALDEMPAAIELYGRALALYLTTGDERQLAITYHHRGYCRYSVEEVEAALEDLERALPLYRKTGDVLGEAQTLNELGVAHRFLGEGREALLAYDDALDLWRQLGNRDQEARTLHNRGRLYLSLGRPERGLADLAAALAIRREIGRAADVVATLNFLGLAHVRRGDSDEALEHFREALALAGTSERHAAAISLAGSGEVYHEQGRLEEGLSALRQARARFKTLEDRAWEAATTAALGRLHLARGDAASALAYLERARELFSAIRDRTGMADALLGKAAAERRLGGLEAARQSIEAALTEVEDLRSRAASGDELRAYFLATKQRYYDFYAELLMELDGRHPGEGWAVKALGAVEQARARSLLESLGEERQSTIDPELKRQRFELEDKINGYELRLIDLAAEDQREAMAASEREQAELLRQHERLREQIRAAGGELPSTPAVLDPAEIQGRLLDPETLLLVYRLGEERSFLWAVSADELAGFELPARADLEDVVVKTHGLIVENESRSRERIKQLLTRLSNELLAPAAPLLAGKRRLVLMADGALHLLPFAALPDPGSDEGEPLVAEHEIVLIPSASSLALLRARGAARQPAPHLLAMVADPVFGKLYPRLEHARPEAEAILALVPAQEQLAALGADASRDVITSGKLGRYRLVHFATHGELDTEHPELSRLVLSLVDAQGRPRDDGLLYAHEIRDLDLPVELVVLSACQTALGKRVAGEGVLGLPRNLLDASASRVVVSLWSVADQPTAELMERFYRALLVEGLAPPAALATAQNEIRRDPRWRDPVDWAGFVFQGEWGDLPRASRDPEQDLKTGSRPEPRHTPDRR